MNKDRKMSEWKNDVTVTGTNISGKHRHIKVFTANEPPHET